MFRCLLSALPPIFSDSIATTIRMIVRRATLSQDKMANNFGLLLSLKIICQRRAEQTIKRATLQSWRGCLETGCCPVASKFTRVEPLRFAINQLRPELLAARRGADFPESVWNTDGSWCKPATLLLSHLPLSKHCDYSRELSFVDGCSSSLKKKNEKEDFARCSF